MIPFEKLDQIRGRFEFLEARLNAGAAVGRAARRSSREYAELKPVVARDRRLARRCCASARRPSGCSPTPRCAALAEEELARLARGAARGRAGGAAGAAAAGTRPTSARRSSRSAPAPAARRRRCSRPISRACTSASPRRAAGAGRWSRRPPTELGGFRELVARGQRRRASSRAEVRDRGVHRVQRVPATESGGRIHTSAATVAVLPEAEEVDIDIPAAGHPHRHHARLRRRRAARQHHRLGGADHPPADRHRGDELGEVAAPEPGAGDAGAARPALRPRAAAARRRARRRPQGPGRLAATARSASAPTTSRKAG